MVYITTAYNMHILSSYYSINLMLANKPILSTINIYICAVTNLILNYFLIKSYGIKGAAIATCLSFSLQFLLELFFSYKFTKIRLMFDWESFGKTLFSSTIMMGALLLLRAYEINRLVDLIMAVAIGTVIYFLCQFILRFFDFNEAIGILEILEMRKYSSYFPVKHVLSYLKKDHIKECSIL